MAAACIYAWLPTGDEPPLAMRTETPWQRMAGAAQTLYLGSCLARPIWFWDEKILDTIVSDATRQPAPAMLWLGDTLYYQSADLTSAEAMTATYRKQRSNASLQRLLTAMPNYAIWDDHDFGPDNADRTFTMRSASQQVFRAQWPNQQPVAKDGSIYTAIRRGDVELFLTDGRSFRDPTKGEGPAAAMPHQ